MGYFIEKENKVVKKRFIKKICSIFLALVFCMPLVFCSACDAENTVDKPCMVIVYKPYAGNTGEEHLKTYGEEMYDDIMLMSQAVLAGLVDTYGQGSIGDGLLGILQRENNPSLNGVSIAQLFGENSMDYSDQLFYAQELNKTRFAKYESSWELMGINVDVSALTLSQTADGGLSATDMLAFAKYYPPAAAVVAALELAGRGIRVNSVMPAEVLTPMALRARSINDTVNAADFVAPLGPSTPQEVANTIAFLLSDATKTISGTSIRIDGCACA